MRQIELLLGKKGRRFIGDAALNLAAYGIPLAVVQVVVLPLMARVVDGETNGLILSLIALFNLFPSTMGNALNNIRLLEDDVYEADDDSYRLLLLLSTVVDAVFIVILTWYYAKAAGINMVFMVLTSSLMLFQEYLKAEYRITLDYKAVAVNAIILSVGYLVGYLVFMVTGEWGLIYLVAQVLSTGYVICTTRLWRGSYRGGPQLLRVSRDYAVLLGSSLLGRAVGYADRLLLYPMMGGYAVSVYYAATLLGKLLSTVVTPLNSVMLSYLARIGTKPDRLFWAVCTASGLACIVAYGVTIAVSRPILFLIYPQYADDSLSLIWVTTAAAYLTVLASVLNPFVLKYSSIHYQLSINVVYLTVYTGVSLLMLRWYGLIGFCWGSLVAATVRIVFLFMAYGRGKATFHR